MPKDQARVLGAPLQEQRMSTAKTVMLAGCRPCVGLRATPKTLVRARLGTSMDPTNIRKGLGGWTFYSSSGTTTDCILGLPSILGRIRAGILLAA